MRVNGGSNYVPTVLNLIISLKKKLLELLIAKKKALKGLFAKIQETNNLKISLPYMSTVVYTVCTRCQKVNEV